MKAIVQTRFGRPDEVLRLEDIEEPAVAGDQVLVRVRAASIAAGDAHVTRGVPYVMRPVFVLTRAKNRVPGTDIAGTVEAVGEQVTRFAPGDDVFGWCKGAFAEFAATPEDTLTTKPANLGFDRAAAVGVSAFTALQALRDRGNVRAGQKVLITGASGGVGSFAVQIAKSLGAEVTGVCSTANLEMVRALGADHVIDYTRDDFTRGLDRFDVVLDNTGTRSLAATRRVLTPDGILVANGGPVGGWTRGLGRPVRAALVSIFVRRQGRPFVSMPTPDDLAALRALVETGTVTPFVGATYPLEATPQAVAHVAEGHARGKTVVTV